MVALNYKQCFANDQLQSNQEAIQEHFDVIDDKNVVIIPQKPLVSILMASFNRGSYLKKTIQSVQEQTYSNWEILIVDNGSSKPETLEVLDQIERGELNDDRVRLFRLHTDYGNCATPRNYAIPHVRGQYVAFLDDDDRWYPEKLEKQITFLEQNQQYDLISSRYDCVTHDDEWCGNFQDRPQDPEAYKFELLFSNIIGISTVVVRYSDKIKPHFYHEHLLGEDYELWMRLIFKNGFKIAHIPKYLASYRIHNSQISTTAYKKGWFNWIDDYLIDSLDQAYPAIFNTQPLINQMTSDQEEFNHKIQQQQSDQVPSNNSSDEIYQSDQQENYQQLCQEPEKQCQNPNIYVSNLYNASLDQHNQEEIRNQIEADFKDLKCLTHRHLDGCEIKDIERLKGAISLFYKFYRDQTNSIEMMRAMQRYQNIIKQIELDRLIRVKMTDENGVIEGEYYDFQQQESECAIPYNHQTEKITIISQIIESPQYLKDSIQSLRKQTYTNWEIIILDDGREEFNNTRAILQELTGLDYRIKLIQIGNQQKDNSNTAGQQTSQDEASQPNQFNYINQALQDAEGDYIVFFQLESIMTSYRLCAQVSYLQQNENIDVLGGKYLIADDWDEQITKSSKAMSSEELRLKMLFGNELIHSTVIIRNFKDKIKPILSYEINSIGADHGLWVKMMYNNYANFAIMDDYLVAIREDSVELEITQHKYEQEKESQDNLIILFEQEFYHILGNEDVTNDISSLYEDMHCLIKSLDQQKIQDGCITNKQQLQYFLINLLSHYSYYGNERMTHLIKEWIVRVSDAQQIEKYHYF
eukprot:403344578